MIVRVTTGVPGRSPSAAGGPGAKRFPLVGEPLPVDLVNTRIRQAGRTVDLLGSPPALAAWLRAQRARVAWSGDVSAADLAAVRHFRTTLDALFAALRAGQAPVPATVAALNHVLSAGAAGAPQLHWTDAGPQLEIPQPDRQREALLWLLAHEAVDLLTRGDAPYLRQCAHPACRLQFVTQNPRRRWCSPGCGNRARVARHYARHR